MSQLQNGSNWRQALCTIVDNDWLILLILLPLVLFPRPVTYVALMLIPLLWVLRKLSHGSFVLPTPSDLVLVIFLVMILVSLFATFDITVTAPRVAGLVYGIAVYYAAASAASRTGKTLAAGVGLLLLFGFIVALLALFGARWPDKLPLFLPITSRLPQLLVLQSAPRGFSPNEVAGTLLWVLPLYLTLTVSGLAKTQMLRAGPARIRWIVLALLAGSLVIAGTFALTQSRSGFFGLAATVLFMALAGSRNRPFALLAGLLGIMVLGLGLILAISPEPAPNSQNSPLQELSASLSATESWETRLEIWSRARYGLEDFPVTGIGLGTFRYLAPVLYPMFLVSPETDIAHAHNHLLQTGLDLGLPGLVAYLALWLLAGLMLWQSWKLRRQNGWLQALILGFAGALVGYFVYGLAETVALGAKPGFMFWLLLGLIAALHHWLIHSDPI